MWQQHFVAIVCAVVYGFQTCNSATTSRRESTQDVLPSLQREVEDNSRYKTLEANATLLKLLVSDKNGVSRTEVFDMLHSRDDNEAHLDLPPFPEDEEDFRDDVPLPPEPKQQAELLQGPDSIVDHDSAREWAGERDSSESRSAAAFVMVVVVCAIVLAAYAALIVWRRIYLQRNGLKHEQLKNEPNIEETIDM